MNPQRLENFDSAVRTLREFTSAPMVNKRDLAGTVFGFVLAFELAWKCVQDRIIDMGYAERGPKAVLSAALKADLIPVTEAETWAQMLEDRNLSSHTYSEAFADELARRIAELHVSALERLRDRLKQAPNASA